MSRHDRLVPSASSPTGGVARTIFSDSTPREDGAAAAPRSGPWSGRCLSRPCCIRATPLAFGPHPPRLGGAARLVLRAEPQLHARGASEATAVPLEDARRHRHGPPDRLRGLGVAPKPLRRIHTAGRRCALRLSLPLADHFSQVERGTLCGRNLYWPGGPPASPTVALQWVLGHPLTTSRSALAAIRVPPSFRTCCMSIPLSTFSILPSARQRKEFAHQCEPIKLCVDQSDGKQK